MAERCETCGHFDTRVALWSTGGYCEQIGQPMDELMSCAFYEPRGAFEPPDPLPLGQVEEKTA